MSINSSSANDSQLHRNNSSPNSNYHLLNSLRCFSVRPGSSIFTSFSITNLLLLLPLCIFILHLGFQRWRKQRSTSAATTTSHSDSFTYHVVTMELFSLFGCTLICFGIHKAHSIVTTLGFYIWSFTWYGEIFFHLLTCVERYLAVVHPIIYLSLRGERGVRIRNVSIGCVWLLCSGGISVMVLAEVSMFVDFCFLMFSLTIISYCSLSVLWALTRPGPGEQGRERKWVDQSKRRSFYSILAILGVLLLRFFWSLLWLIPYVLRRHRECVVLVSDVWFNLPCSLVLPLLFLHRAGKLVCCRDNTNQA